MTVLDLNRKVSRLSGRELKELHAHVVRMRHNSPERRKGMAKKLRAVAAGRFVRAEQLEKRIAGEVVAPLPGRFSERANRRSAWEKERRWMSACHGGRLCYLAAMTATDVIRQIEALPAPERAKVRDWLEASAVEESPEMLAALDAAVRSAEERGTTPADEVRRLLPKWISKSA